MKLQNKLLSLLLLVCILATSIPCAMANDFTYFQKEDQLDYAKGCLTEVFGYSYEDAESFCFQQSEQDGIATFSRGSSAMA